MPRRPRAEAMSSIPCRRWFSIPWRWLTPLALAAGLSSLAAAAPGAGRIDLSADIPGASDMAAPANGQTLYVLDEARGEVAALDPFEPSKRRVAVGADGAARPIAIACVDTGMLAMLCREPEGWTLRTHRIRPDAVADAAAPAQRTVLVPGRPAAEPAAAPTAGRPRLVVSPSRDWLAICGLPAPLPPVLRAPIAGSRVGAMSAKGCPVPGVARVDAAAISPGEELVLFQKGDQDRLFLSYFLPPAPRPLLHLDAGLGRVADAGFCRGDGTLWVVGGGVAEGGEAEGLWRIDAVLREGRQAARAVLVARLDAASSLVALSERAVVVAHGREDRIVTRIDPTKQSGVLP
ncbi:MAG: hypothetical protein RLZZ111_2078 [Planctomycetota bacterium]|jgi:hypothetical protein